MNKASCLCGALTWEISGEPFYAFNCHCKICRKAHGSPFATYWFLKREQFHWTSATDTLVNYRSSEFLDRSFCGSCGSVAPYGSEGHDTFLSLGGCHAEGKKSDCNVFVAHNAPWHDITGDLPGHDDYPEYTGFPRVEEEPMALGPEGVVRGSCLCGDIEFHLTEPFKVVHNCHCTRCRRARAAAHATNGFVSLDGIQFVKGEEHLKTYKLPEAKFFTQVFCETCGGKMPRVDTERSVAVVPLGALDDDPKAKALDHIFVAYKAGWHDITDDLPTYEEGPTG